MIITSKYLIIHHSLTKTDSKPKTFDAVNNYHRDVVKFTKSSLGFFCGYHYWIEDNGRIVQARRNNEEGCHTKENEMNFKSIGIGIEGNFDVEKFEGVRVFALRDLLKKLCQELNLTKDDIYFHRTYADYKSCPGKNVDLCFVRSLLK